MSRSFTVAAILGGSLVAASAQAPAPTPSPAPTARMFSDVEINAFIGDGKGSGGLTLGQSMAMNHSGLVITLYSPPTWFRHQFQLAKREMRPFGPADVLEEWRRDVWRLHAEPDFPEKLTGPDIKLYANNVTHAVIRDQYKTIVIQPLIKVPFQRSNQSAMSSLTLTGMDFEFPSGAVLELWGKTQDRRFWVTVIGDNSTYDWEIKDKHFKDLK